MLAERHVPPQAGRRTGYHASMRAIGTFLLLLLFLCVLAAGVAWFWASRQAGPTIVIRGPERFIGQTTSLELTVEAPEGRFSRIDVGLEQNGRTLPVFALGQPSETGMKQESAERIYVMRPIGKRAIPDLQEGAARIVVHATRPVLFGLRQAESSATRDVQVRLQPPRVAVLSTHHYVNHGGAEFVVYRATPPDTASGVRVGEHTYPGFPGSAAGLSDPAVRVAFFALLADQDLSTPVELFARDEAGNEATAVVDHRPFPKPFRRSRIEVDDRFLQRVVPAIATNTRDMQIDTSDLVQAFLRINGELRRRNAETIASLAQKSAPEMRWKDRFQQLGNSQVEAGFADHRTYLYKGKEIDQQVHLGFDLAVTANVPIVAAQRGAVIFADYLGIYGNCVIVDHGLGVQSLYAHLSSIDVKPGQNIDKGHVLGRSGMTGLAGGDHLHFTMLVNGQPVNPVEWWDTKWTQDRVFRKITEAGGPPPSATP
jgi:murein DD-endopeptidase MepM/ murein hydrolase activator NlpD